MGPRTSGSATPPAGPGLRAELRPTEPARSSPTARSCAPRLRLRPAPPPTFPAAGFTHSPGLAGPPASDSCSHSRPSFIKSLCLGSEVSCTSFLCSHPTSTAGASPPCAVRAPPKQPRPPPRSHRPAAHCLHPGHRPGTSQQQGAHLQSCSTPENPRFREAKHLGRLLPRDTALESSGPWNGDDFPLVTVWVWTLGGSSAGLTWYHSYP